MRACGACGLRGLVVVLFSCLLQTIGFSTPVWFCKKGDFSTVTNTSSTLNNSTLTTPSTNVQETCDFHGLFYPEGIKDRDVFGLCVTSIFGVWVCAIIKLYCQLRMAKDDEGRNLKIACCVMFVIFEIFAGVAGIVCFARYDRIGWSLILFVAVGLATLSIIGLVIVLCCCVLVCSGNARGRGGGRGYGDGIGDAIFSIS